MHLQDEFLFDINIDAARASILDEDTLISLIPAAKKFTKIATGKYEANIPVKVLLFTSDMQATVTLSDQDREDCRSFSCVTHGSLGKAHAQGNIYLTPEKEQTKITYKADITIEGKFASMAEQFIKSSGKASIKKGLLKLAEKITALSQQPSEE